MGNTQTGARTLAAALPSSKTVLFEGWQSVCFQHQRDVCTARMHGLLLQSRLLRAGTNLSPHAQHTLPCSDASKVLHKRMSHDRPAAAVEKQSQAEQLFSQPSVEVPRSLLPVLVHSSPARDSPGGGCGG